MEPANETPIVTPHIGLAHRPEVLHAFYCARLCSDRSHLMTVRVHLDRAGTNPMPLYEELLAVTRRMAGAAALFEAGDVVSAASTLERAVLAATVRHTPKTRADARRALDAMVNLLYSLRD
jgi:hypothetical protein